VQGTPEGNRGESDPGTGSALARIRPKIAEGPPKKKIAKRQGTTVDDFSIQLRPGTTKRYASSLGSPASGQPRYRARFRLALIVAALVAASGAAVAQSRPNIVVVIGDDHGWPYSGFMGDPIVRTPNLDALAAEGMVFTHGFTTASVCLPSQRTLLAGIQSDQWDRKRAALEDLLGDLPVRQEVAHYRTLPRDLARVGYRSFQGGKMWEGDFDQAGFTDGTATEPPSSFFEIVGHEFGRTGIEPLRTFLDGVGTDPFLVWFAPTLPHVPFDAPQAFRAPYQELGRTPREVEYYANVSRLDAVVGELLTELDQRGLRESTLVVYLSDNGWELGRDNAFALPFHHGKGTAHELGNRTPIVLRWPGTIPAGVRRDDLVSSEDLVPTLLEYAGADPNPELRGRSLVDAVRTGAPFGRTRVVTETDRGGGTDYAVRVPGWRYIAFRDGHEELYAIDADPYETTDVAATYPALLPGFRADVQAFLTDLDTLPARPEVIGRLVDPLTGTPVGGAVVRLALSSVRLESLTDANGWFAFRAVPPGDCVVDRVRGASSVQWMETPSIDFPVPLGSLGAYLPLTGISRGRTVVGPYDAEIRGVVRDLNGAPVQAEVRARGATVGGRVRLTVLSDEQGRYRAEHLPIGTYRLRARRVRYGTASAVTQLVAPGAVALDLTLPARH
jgi:arylsulfatase A-like enzyme